LSQYEKNTVLNSSDRENRLLLVVDSNPDHLFYTSTLLSRFNYKTLTAGTAEEALEITTHIVPSLIITSMSLRDMDGIELIQQFKKNPYTAAVPLIALRKQDDLAGERLSLEIGAVECLYHPVDAEILYRVVQIVVEKNPRTYMRIRMLQPVKINKKQSAGFESAFALDLSEHGMFLQTAEPAGRNARLSIEMDLKGRIIPVTALVVYSYKKPGGPYLQTGMGLEFVQIKLSDQAYIRDFIRNEVTRGIVPGNA
jgi:CheY-like chemotaxis protein